MTRKLNLQSEAQLLLPELVIDSFAGAGGVSAGMEMVLGRGPDLAINHDAHAVAIHQLNHPRTLHLCQDVLTVDPNMVCAGRRVGLLWASPDCRHFARAKNGRPVSASVRGLAWAVVEWAKTVAPRIIALENVREFADWGPLDADGIPIKSRKGETFRKWVGQLRAEGYQVEWRVLRACDYGAPTTRERLFVIARCDGDPIVWPEPTHEPIPAREIIRPEIEAPSIHRRSRKLAAKTMERIRKGTQRYVLDRLHESEDLFELEGGDTIFWIAKHYGGMVGNPIGRPLSTVTAVDHHGLVAVKLGRKGERAPAWVRRFLRGDGFVETSDGRRPIVEIGHRMLEPVELADATGFGPDYRFDFGSKRDQIARIGNAVPPQLAAALIGANYQYRPVTAATPLRLVREEAA